MCRDQDWEEVEVILAMMVMIVTIMMVIRNVMVVIIMEMAMEEIGDIVGVGDTPTDHEKGNRYKCC